MAASHRVVDLTAATSPYQLLQDIVDAVLPPVVNTFGAKPTVTLHSLLAQIPANMLTDVLNANGGAININSLLGTLGTSGTSLNSTVTDAITSALTDYLATATTGQGAADLKSMLSGAISSAVADKLNGLKISVNIPILGNQSISLAQVVGAAGITNIANSVADTVAGNIVNNLGTILPTPEELANDITPALPNLLNTVLSSANLTDPNGNFQLGNLLNLLGVNLGSIEAANALTVTSAGPLFTLARLFGGVDLGWVPGTQTAIANSVNNTGYLDIGTSTLKTNLAAALAGALSDGSLAASLTDDLNPVLNTVVSQIVDNATESLESQLTDSINGALSGLNYTVKVPIVGNVSIPVGDALKSAIDPLISSLASSLNGNLQGSVSGAIDGAIGSATGSINDALGSAVDQAINAIPDEDIADLRIPIVLGTGLGAFSAGAAYKDVLAKLASQPGGVDYTGAAPLLGSLTILPELLLNNAGRANGGLLARFSSVLKLLGIDAVTPDVAISSSGGTAVGDTGLALGGANLVPIKIDATAEYQLLSDFAAWPNPFTLVNNVAAGLLPTYMLRGLDGAAALGQVGTALESLVGGLTSEGAVDPNIYLTVAAKTLPLLEPMYLVGDVLNMVGLHPLAGVVGGLARALSPALTSLVNLGYSDAYWNPATGQYERTLDSAAQQVQFGTLPHIDWAQVVPNIVTSLVKGFKTAFTANNSVPNALEQVGSLLSGGGINGAIDTLLSGATGAAAGAEASVNAAAAVDGVAPQALRMAADDGAPVRENRRQHWEAGAAGVQAVAGGDASGQDSSAQEPAPVTKAQKRAAWKAKHEATKNGTDAGTTDAPKSTDTGKKNAEHTRKGSGRQHDGDHGADRNTGKQNTKSDAGKQNSHKHQGGSSKGGKHAA